MTEFIIASAANTNKYLQRGKSGKMSATNQPGLATRFADKGKAWRVLNSQIPKKERTEWTILAYNEEQKRDNHKRFRASTDMSVVTEKDFDWERVKRNITESFSEIIAYKELLSDRLNQVGAELCDCEHACEFFKYDVVRGYKLYAMIRERRIKRRYYKNELRRVNSILEMSYLDIVSGEIENSFKEIDEQTYKPRVLTELFDDLSYPAVPNEKDERYEGEEKCNV